MSPATPSPGERARPYGERGREPYGGRGREPYGGRGREPYGMGAGQGRAARWRRSTRSPA
ncbi:hypothetical protein D5H75_37465 [Bailinhaonella thermotolerans]|uniref:Uncharacterized protein n=1 Tax=Bailinhaonella thermotolerans TaxID=1070861 RepID=A0A3A3ZZX5_9ACTN|nr:hypothetical protein D5H75_37465 [Bailinhaonella thermotolerans]